MPVTAASLGAPRRRFAHEGPGPDRRVPAVALVLLGGGAWFLASGFGWRQGALYVLGGALGLVLYHASFGFAGSWRRFLEEGRGAGLRAQMIMIALATTAFIPAIAEGSLFGGKVGGAIAPVGLSVLFGAFVFGIGMQLGGGCASGTLFTVGGGSTRMLYTLIFFVLGSLIGSAHAPWWYSQASLGSISLGRALGVGPALALQWGALGLVASITVLVERRRHGGLEGPKASGRHGWRRLLQGPWPLVWGALLLAVLNIATLALSGFPWSVTFGYTLWGAKVARAVGVDVASWPFWDSGWQRAALEASVFANGTSVMNFGILVGAFLAAGLAARFAPTRRVPIGPLLAAVVGGLMMGYGARLAFGCNIGAYFSGIASGSAHGWLWFASAMVGTAIGAKLRPLFRL